MTTEKKATGALLTPEFRVSFPALFQAKFNDLNGKSEFSVQMLFPKGADLTKLKNAAANAAKEKWGTDLPKNLRSPFRDQGEKEYAGYEEGAVYITAKSNQKPGVVDENVQPVIDESEVYGGCFARATVRAYAYDQKGNRGVAFGLNNIQKTRDGEPFGNRSRAEDDFEAVEGADSSGDGDGSADSLFG